LIWKNAHITFGGQTGFETTCGDVPIGNVMSNWFVAACL